MTDSEDAVVYRYEPREVGEHFKGVPQRDLTQADYDRLDLLQQVNATAPHPVHGKPLYVAVEKKAPAGAAKEKD